MTADLIDRRWALANWSVRVAIPVWALETVYGGLDPLFDLERLTWENAGTTGLDALHILGHATEPMVGPLPSARYSEVEKALSETGFGHNARVVMAGGGLPTLIWTRARVLCRLYALEQCEHFPADQWDEWMVWLSGCSKMSTMLGEIHPTVADWSWTG